MPNPIITGQVETLQRIYTARLSVETYTSVPDHTAYLSDFLTEIKMALGITESNLSVIEATQVSMTRRGDKYHYVVSVVLMT